MQAFLRYIMKIIRNVSMWISGSEYKLGFSGGTSLFAIFLQQLKAYYIFKYLTEIKVFLEAQPDPVMYDEMNQTIHLLCNLKY